MSAWLYLSVAIAFEIAGTFFLKLSDGFTNWTWGSVAVLCYWLCFAAFAPALRDLPVGVVYAVWAGLGIVGGVMLGLFVFDEYLRPLQYACIALIGLGAVGLRLGSAVWALERLILRC